MVNTIDTVKDGFYKALDSKSKIHIVQCIEGEFSLINRKGAKAQEVLDDLDLTTYLGTDVPTKLHTILLKSHMKAMSAANLQDLTYQIRQFLDSKDLTSVFFRLVADVDAQNINITHPDEASRLVFQHLLTIGD